MEVGLELLLFEIGGWLVVVIVAVSFIAWVLIAQKWFRLNDESNSNNGWMERVVMHFAQGERNEALAICHQNANMTSRVMAAALHASGSDEASFAKRLRPLIEGETAELRHHLPLIAVLSAILPLLGLLGTVLGMLKTFSALSVGTSIEVGAVADGVSQALITTQAGLIAAFPILLMHGWLAARVQRCVDEAMLYGKRVESVLRRTG